MLAKKTLKIKCLLAAKFQKPFKPGSRVSKSYYDPPKANIYGNLFNSYVSNNICVFSADCREGYMYPKKSVLFYQGHM